MTGLLRSILVSLVLSASGTTTPAHAAGLLPGPACLTRVSFPDRVIGLLGHLVLSGLTVEGQTDTRPAREIP